MKQLPSTQSIEELYKPIIDTLPYGVCIIRQSDKHIILQNRLAKNILTHSSKSVFDILNQTNDIDNNTVINYGSKYASLTISEISQKSIIYLLCTFFDITLFKQTEIQLIDNLRTAETVSKTKSNFLATLSHEIRTPLYGILGSLELMINHSRLEQETEQQLHTVQTSANTLLHLINDVLDLSKIEAGQMDIEYTVFNPVSLIETIARNYVPIAQSRNIDFYLSIDSNLPGQLKGDPLRLQQIIGNLISNAIKFTEHGYVFFQLRFLEKQNHIFQVQFDVSDTGIGMSEHGLKNLFIPFSQVGNQTSLRFGGTGLGLSICKQLIELMHGAIIVRSELDKGSHFSVTLPLYETEEEDDIVPNLTGKKIFLQNHIKYWPHSLKGWLEKFHAEVRELQSLDDAMLDEAKNAVLIITGELPAEYSPSPVLAGCIHVSCYNNFEPQKNGRITHLSAFHLYKIFKEISLIYSAKKTPVENELHDGMSQAIYPQLNLNILIVEDHPINQILLKKQLTMLGCQVTLANHGEEGLKIWSEGENSFDMILTDVNMPVMDGYTLTQKIRSAGGNITIIGISANVMKEEIEHCYLSGMNAHIAKPIAMDVLYQTLQNFAQKKDIES